MYQKEIVRENQPQKPEEDRARYFSTVMDSLKRLNDDRRTIVVITKLIVVLLFLFVFIALNHHFFIPIQHIADGTIKGNGSQSLKVDTGDVQYRACVTQYRSQNHRGNWGSHRYSMYIVLENENIKCTWRFDTQRQTITYKGKTYPWGGNSRYAQPDQYFKSNVSFFERINVEWKIFQMKCAIMHESNKIFWDRFFNGSANAER